MSDIDAISEVLVRYATAIDTRDWELFRTVFTEDAATDYGDMGKWTDLAGIAAFMESALVGFGATNHMLSNFVIAVDGDRATARSYVHVVLAAPEDPGTWIDSVGSYDDTLVRTTAGWRIRTRAFHLTRMVTSDAAP